MWQCQSRSPPANRLPPRVTSLGSADSAGSPWGGLGGAGAEPRRRHLHALLPAEHRLERPARPALRRSPALTRQGPRAARFCPAKRTRSRLPERGHGWGPARPAHAPAGSSAAGTCCPHPPWRQRRPDTARAAPPPEAAPEVPSQGAPPGQQEASYPGRHGARAGGCDAALLLRGPLGVVVFGIHGRPGARFVAIAICERVVAAIRRRCLRANGCWGAR